MGSVKDILRDTNGERLYISPQQERFGRAAWKVSGRFSVADLKGVISSHAVSYLEIPQKGTALAMMAAFYEEAGASHGHNSCYESMMDRDGNMVSVQNLLERGDTSNVVVMRLAHTPQSYEDALPGYIADMLLQFTGSATVTELRPESGEASLQRYHHAISNGTLKTYVADVESIFRRGLPLGSSFFEKVAKAVGLEQEYACAATYDATVGILDEARTRMRAGNFPPLAELLSSVGLTEIPNPGYMLPATVFDATTKFSAEGDVPITERQAGWSMGISLEQYGQWKVLLREDAEAQAVFCKERGIVLMDGKVETVVHNGELYFTDFRCTVDENRMGIPYGNILLPTSKEIQRAVFREHGIYAGILEAKNRHGKDWRTFLSCYVSKDAIPNAVRESMEIMGRVIPFVANRILGKSVFNAPSLEEIARDLLPFASPLQSP